MRREFGCLFAIACGAVMVACSGGSGMPTPSNAITSPLPTATATPSPTSSCGTPLGQLGPLSVLVYPSPGATGVPANIGRILIELPAGTYTLNARTTIQLASPVPAVSPIPSAVAPNIPPSSLYQMLVPTLASQTTYTLVQQGAAIYLFPNGSCNVYGDAPIAVFTTQ